MTNVRLQSGTPSNVTRVSIGSMTLVFSYHTCVAFYDPRQGWVASENVWSATTGRHINQEIPSSGQRVPHERFEQLLERALERIEVRA